MKARILTLTSLSHFINDGNSWFLPVAFTFLITYLDISKFLIGILSGAFFFGISALASPLVSRVADKFTNYSKIMGIGILLWGIGLILFGYSIQLHFLPLTFISVAIAGFASAFYHPIGAAVLSITYKGNAGIALGINGSMGSLGRAIYPTLTLSLFAILNKDMTLDALIIGIISIIAALPSLFLKITITKEEDPKTPSLSTTTNSRSTLFVVILLTIIALLRSVFGQGISQFLPTLLVENYGYSYNVNLGEAITIALAVAVVGQPILGFLSDRVGRRLIYVISTFGAAIALLLFLKIPNIALLSLFGLFNFSAFPLMLSIVGDFVPRNSASFANSLVWGLGVTGGGVIGPIIVGAISQVSNLVFASEIVTVMAFLAGALTALVPKPPKKSKVPLFG
ncbi:major facilitator superfamily MFS_1 [Sulfolobus islandicus Y.N.15.51]|uniref:Major facilitator superfamily MFS_1 n=1 Tax=Saccharolobus islandicus (strain Y.N.15.51 / Yellowstone \|nr:MFS transporter [Sulfolobus islandicus]ACP48717.1 major facilitator superfamily MFS_1 [Sulfolobus islandicus Y.N.15.51]